MARLAPPAFPSPCGGGRGEGEVPQRQGGSPPLPPPPPAGGRITGTVYDAVTSSPVGGVSVALDGNSLISATTNSSGSFTLYDVPPGTHAVLFAASGYASKSASAGVMVDAAANLCNVGMLSSFSTGTIAGYISDAAGRPLSDVAVTVGGQVSKNRGVCASTGAPVVTHVTDVLAPILYPRHETPGC